MSAALYVQTNEADNRVLVFRRDPDGALAQAGSYPTGGAGDNTPHLTSQGSVVLSADGRHLLVTNAASNDVSLFTVGEDGLTLLETIPSGGAAPKSVAEHDGLVYVLNTGTPSLAGFRITEGGGEPIEGGGRSLGPDADPAQVGFRPDGAALVVTDRGTDSIVIYPVDAEGELGPAAVHPSAGPTPYGFAFTRKGTLVVTEAFGAQPGKAAASSYDLENGSIATRTSSIGNGRSEICWAVISADDRYMFATNFADGAISRYAIRPDGTLELEDPAAATAMEGEKGLRDEGLTGDGRFLYAIDTDAQRIFGWSVGEAGELVSVGSWTGLPATVAGLAAS